MGRSRHFLTKEFRVLWSQALKVYLVSCSPLVSLPSSLSVRLRCCSGAPPLVTYLIGTRGPGAQEKDHAIAASFKALVVREKVKEACDWGRKPSVYSQYRNLSGELGLLVMSTSLVLGTKQTTCNKCINEHKSTNCIGWAGI